MTVRELREKYLSFFESKGHLRFPSGSLVPIDVTGRLDESLLFNGAGMIQFKPYFRGVAQPENKRLTTCQKCVRTGDIEEVGDDTHLTFFEMLGNFSFGDYFKSEAIAYSWEFLTDASWLGLDKTRLSFTVYEEDDEAYTEWSRWLSAAGISPSARVVKLDEETNYWPAGAFSKGPPGPCGPNSEMFYWVSEEPVPSTTTYTQEDWVRDEAEGKWVEIWNDVFIQFDWAGHLKDPSNSKLGYEKDGMPELPFRSIDTGMGLERTALVLAGKKSVYDFDLFEPILAKIDELSGSLAGDQAVAKARRIVADHIRTSTFCIVDGVLPANTGRGYVLRRLIRRAVLQGDRKLGIHEPFLYQVFDGVVASMGSFYPELEERRATIVDTLKREEEAFRRTLAAGSDLLRDALEDLAARGETTLPGDVAFRLYDTFGFPLEVTQEIAAEAHVQVDADGYDNAMRDAQALSRGAQNRESVYGGLSTADERATPDAPETTNFLGYTLTSAPARIVRVRPLTPNPLSPDEPQGRGGLLVALDATPFYAESGGQTGDIGWLELPIGELKVEATTKSAGTFWHKIAQAPEADLLGQPVIARVDVNRRDRIRRNHTATHLLHAALRQVLGDHVSQAGSYVGPENLRFDFTHGEGMSPEQVAEVEAIVNREVLANTGVDTHVDLPIAEAKARGAMALFGEKYGDKVRMVEVGEFSRELCGGIHVRSTGEIGLFKITSESSAAGGVRRIEAITGEGAYAWVVELDRRMKEASGMLKTQPSDLAAAIQRTLDQVRDERKRREKAEMAALSGGGSESNSVIEVKGVKLWTQNFGEVDQKIAAQAVDNQAAQNPNQVTVAAVVNEGKVTFIAKVGDEAKGKGAHAGNLLREVAKIAGGGGGGRPDFATAGGKLPEKVDEALAAAAGVLEKSLA